MLSLEEAREKMLESVRPLPIERVPLAAATERFLAETVVSPLDLPAFDNSAMDGYAVRAADGAAAASTGPVALKRIGAAAAGEVFESTVRAGTCVRVFTGSALPTGADAVVMQEDTRLDPERPGEVLLLEPVKPWENVRFRGEDVKRGQVVLAAGERISAARAGLMAALGLESATVRARPVVGLLATGSELLEPGQPAEAGKIFESNRVTLAPLLAGAGAVPRVFPLVRDTLAETRQALELAFAACNAVVTTGGVSVGEMDFVKTAFEHLGGTLEFWKVAIRPGKPFVFGRLGEKLLFGLPGNPVSAMVTFLMLVRPVLLRWQGAAQVELPSHPGLLAQPLANHSDRRHFLRVRVDAAGAVSSAGTQASHLLGSMAMANGLLDVPPRTTWPTGTPVSIWRIED